MQNNLDLAQQCIQKAATILKGTQSDNVEWAFDLLKIAVKLLKNKSLTKQEKQELTFLNKRNESYVPM